MPEKTLLTDIDLDLGDAVTPPDPESKKVAMCLSGGGFRASLFHLGALTRLNELGVLSRIDTFSSVSGGSIIAAHLARVLTVRPFQDGETVYPDWHTSVVKPFLEFTQKDIRGSLMLRLLWPVRWFREGAAVKVLQESCETLTAGLTLPELPDKPRFIFCATDMTFTKNWVCEKERVGDWVTGYASTSEHPWPVSKAVAASACFPPVFTPMPTELPAKAYQKGRRGYYSPEEFDQLRENIRLTDGGVYDNLGLEPVWKNHGALLVSDAGKPITHESTRLHKRIMRYSSMIMDQVGSLRRRMLFNGFYHNTYVGAYWRITSAPERYDESLTYGYSKDLARGVIAKVRTDLDHFTDQEIDVLMTHGYQLADAGVRTHVPELMVHPNATMTRKNRAEDVVKDVLNDNWWRKRGRWFRGVLKRV